MKTIRLAQGKALEPIYHIKDPGCGVMREAG